MEKDIGIPIDKLDNIDYIKRQYRSTKEELIKQPLLDFLILHKGKAFSVRMLLQANFVKTEFELNPALVGRALDLLEKEKKVIKRLVKISYPTTYYYYNETL